MTVDLARGGHTVLQLYRPVYAIITCDLVEGL